MYGNASVRDIQIKYIPFSSHSYFLMWKKPLKFACVIDFSIVFYLFHVARKVMDSSHLNWSWVDVRYIKLVFIKKTYRLLLYCTYKSFFSSVKYHSVLFEMSKDGIKQKYVHIFTGILMKKMCSITKIDSWYESGVWYTVHRRLWNCC